MDGSVVGDSEFCMLMMASNNGDVSSEYHNFFETFASTVNVNDPLPVKVGSHSIRDNEVEGEIVDWTLQYLQQKYVVFCFYLTFALVFIRFVVSGTAHTNFLLT